MPAPNFAAEQQLELLAALCHSQLQQPVHQFAEARLLAEELGQILISLRRIGSNIDKFEKRKWCWWLYMTYQWRWKLDNLAEDWWTKNPSDACNQTTYFKFFFQTVCPKMIAPKKNLHWLFHAQKIQRAAICAWKKGSTYHTDDDVDSSRQDDKSNEKASKVLKNWQLEITNTTQLVKKIFQTYKTFLQRGYIGGLSVEWAVAQFFWKLSVRDNWNGKKHRTDIGVDGDKNAEEDQEFDYVEWQQICRAQIFRAKSLHKIKYCVQQEPARQKLTLPRIYDSSDSPAKRY